MIKPPAKRIKQNVLKFKFFQKLLILLGLIIVSFTLLPVVVILFLGLLPTLTVAVTDTKNISKITTVGCFNMAGVMICLNSLFNQFGSEFEFSILNNIFNIVIMLAAAALGVLLYYLLPDLFVFIFKNSAQHRLKTINSKLEKLTETWANIIPEDR